MFSACNAAWPRRPVRRDNLTQAIDGIICVLRRGRQSPPTSTWVMPHTSNVQATHSTPKAHDLSNVVDANRDRTAVYGRCCRNAINLPRYLWFICMRCGLSAWMRINSLCGSKKTVQLQRLELV